MLKRLNMLKVLTLICIFLHFKYIHFIIVLFVNLFIVKIEIVYISCKHLKHAKMLSFNQLLQSFRKYIQFTF